MELSVDENFLRNAGQASKLMKVQGAQTNTGGEYRIYCTVAAKCLI